VKPTSSEATDDRKKRKKRPEDDIDALFDERLGKKVKKHAVAVAPSLSGVTSGKLERDATRNEDKDLEQVLGAIKSAPKSDTLPKKHKDSRKSHVHS
jgi:nucleolar protein 9